MQILSCIVNGNTEHKCDQHGCESMIIIDGNMKNHRHVSTHAGYAKYKGLPDAIRTGCPNTPALKSRFCSVHKPILPTPGNDEHLSSASPPSIRQQRQPEMVIGKHSTRQGYFQHVVVLKERIQTIFSIKPTHIIEPHLTWALNGMGHL